MTAERGVDAHGEQTLVITDMQDEHVEFTRTPGGGTGCMVLVDARTPALVAIDLEDGLALLSFLADALGVERFVPGGAP